MNYIIYTFKYHVSCTDGKISVRIIHFTYFSTIVPSKRFLFLSCSPRFWPTGKKYTTVGWDEGGKIGKKINSNIIHSYSMNNRDC